ncbi:Thioredoxin-like fold [Phaffia rhodozyma]|uniref:Thioredoxin-like fold n=1 Tax=Phaffia rhodozyma TaxID=264483 RepID=A0A0F7SXW5_PHARH|nr:Thioredoxin-like fold [Phaffia rhodozyma]
MSLKPSLSFLRIGSPSSPHTLEVWIDYLCPFSAKIVKSLDENVLPLINQGGKYESKVQLIIRLQPQPWHGSSTYLHESALAFGKVEPTKFWEYTTFLFENQTAFFDIPSSGLTVVQIREKLQDLAGKVLSNPSQKSQILELITPKTTPNGGVSVTDDLKYNIKIGRQNGIHVTPTALFDGLIDNSVSSSFGKAEWEKFFTENVTI